MKKLVLREYATGNIMKRISIPQDTSIRYGMENGRMVVRNYNTSDKIKSCAVPDVSFTFSVECV